jgi:hypothetical protein
MSINEIWYRLLVTGGDMCAYAAVAYVAFWLWTVKGVGHKKLLLVGALFGAARVVSHLGLLSDLYFLGRLKHLWMPTLNLLFSLPFAVYLVMQKWNLRRTLTRTETAHVLELEKKLNCQTEVLLNRAVDAANLDISTGLVQQQRELIH